jgi:iron(III) transport system permease protein
MRRPSASDRALVAATIVPALLAALPIAVVLAHVFLPGHADTWRHLASTVLPTYVGNTLVLFVCVGAGTAAIGTTAAWLVTTRAFPGSGVFAWALLLPLAMPAYVSAYAYTDFLEFAGPLQTSLRETFGWRRGDYWFPDIRSVGGAAAMLVFVLYPYVYLLARTAFLERSPSLAEASRTLGHGRLSTFLRIEVPLARPAIAGGIGLALMETLADYGTVAYFAVDTFTTGIYRAWFSLGDRVAAAQLAAALLAFVALAILFERSTRWSAAAVPGGRAHSPRPPALRRLRGAGAALAVIACATPIALGFVAPVLLLLRLLAQETELVAGARFAELAWNSVRVAAVAAAVAAGLALLVGYAVRLRPSWPVRGSSRLLALGYAVPGSVLAVGVLIPLARLDNTIAAFATTHLGIATGLLFTGSIAALVYAYVVRYFTVAWNSVDSGFARITLSMDAAARSLGEGTLGTLRRVHAPLLWRSLAAGVLLAFVDVMKELPATLVMRPFNFDTLATQAYTLAKDERLAEAALPSLAIVAVGLLPIVLLSRSMRRTRSSGAPHAGGAQAAPAG